MKTNKIKLKLLLLFLLNLFSINFYAQLTENTPPSWEPPIDSTPPPNFTDNTIDSPPLPIGTYVCYSLFIGVIIGGVKLLNTEKFNPIGFKKY